MLLRHNAAVIFGLRPGYVGCRTLHRDKCAAAVEFPTYVTAAVCDLRNTTAAVEMLLTVDMFESTAAVANVTEALLYLLLLYMY